MSRNIVILKDREKLPGERINWDKIGPTVTEIAQLYQSVKERPTDLILVGGRRSDLNQSVANRLRRPNGLTEIWKLTVERYSRGEIEGFYDGAIAVDSGQGGIQKRIKQLLDEKELLEQYRIVGRSAAMKALARTIDQIAASEVSVLIVGPSGSGKELVAQAVHSASGRARNPFVAINCGALAEGVLESELFGHEKGAFTGSVGKREGLFAKAESGTIFLDEIGETKPGMQVKLLRVLEDGTYYPVGSSTPKRANVRVVAATNRDLMEAIAEKSFREDLYFRIGAVKLVVPSLMERRGDIQPLLQHFWKDLPKLDYADTALERLMRYDWPGNVRQLRNFASRMAALKPEGMVETEDVDRFLTEQNATAKHLPVSTGRTSEEAGQELIYRAILQLGTEVRMLRNLITANLPSEAGAVHPVASATSAETASTMEEMERVMIEQMLRETGGNRKETARRLGIGERTLYRKLTKYDLR